MALPARRVRKPAEKRERSPAHLKFVRSHDCCVPGCKRLPIEAAHVRAGTDGGTGMKPSDCWAISLCSHHHAEQHRVGEPAFEATHGISMKSLATEFAQASDAWKRAQAKKGAQR